jgi:hypothetical protein
MGLLGPSQGTQVGSNADEHEAANNSQHDAQGAVGDLSA